MFHVARATAVAVTTSVVVGLAGITASAVSQPTGSAPPTAASAAQAPSTASGDAESAAAARRDAARRAAAARAARHLARGGAPRYLDSGHPVWAKTPTWIREVGLCIRRHESIRAGHYRAHNRYSSAAGAYQFTSGTWLGNARYATWKGKHVARGYAAADHAPAWVQDVVFIHAVTHGGLRAWHGTWCPGT